MGKSTISIAIFNSYLLVHQRVAVLNKGTLFPRPCSKEWILHAVYNCRPQWLMFGDMLAPSSKEYRIEIYRNHSSHHFIRAIENGTFDECLQDPPTI